MTIAINYQDWATQSIIPAKYIRKNPEQYLNNCTDTERKIIDSLLYFTTVYKDTFVSQSKIAHYHGITRKTVNKYLQKLHSLGLIFKKNRGVKRTCEYSISSWFFNPHIYFRLRKYFTSLQSQIALRKITVPDVVSNKKVTLYRTRLFRNIYINNNNPPTRHTMSHTIPPILSHFKTIGLNLTMAGKIKLMAFDEDTLTTAFKVLKDMHVHVRNPFNLIYAQCLRSYELKASEPDFALVHELLQMNGLHSESPVIVSNQPYKPKNITMPVTNSINPAPKPVVKQEPYKATRSQEDPELTKIKLQEFLRTEAGQKAYEAGFFPISLLSNDKPIEQPKQTEPNPYQVNQYRNLLNNRISI